MGDPTTAGASDPSASTPSTSPAATLADATKRKPSPRSDWFALRTPVRTVDSIVFGSTCLLLVLLVWWFVTRGESEERIISATTIPSPAETFSMTQLKELWFDRALTRNTIASLKRVSLGFLVAVGVGIPLGVACGCFGWMAGFLAPVTIFGRNVPMAALIPLTFSLFGIGELQKIMFIFLATVAFVISDTADAIREVGSRYVDTAYTLGASRWQIITKVLVPLAMPSVFNSLRLLFGLAFGYIMLAEVVQITGESGGLGQIINISRRRNQMEPVLLVLFMIPAVALAIDRLLFWIQRELFPHQYGGSGTLHNGLRAIAHAWDDIKSALRPAAAKDLK